MSASLQDTLKSLKEEALSAVAAVDSPSSLEEWRIKYLSRQGLLPAALEGMKTLSKEDRPIIGKLANEVKTALQTSFDEKKEHFETSDTPDVADPTMPGRELPFGQTHVINQTLDRIVSIFRRMGYSIEDGPDVETEFHNFDALNTPPEHPARNEQDTFYVDQESHEAHGRWLLRSQTSPVQIRVMQRMKPPVKIIAPGRCYRRDEIDATHGVFFHQVEGLVVGEDITLQDLKGTLEFFYREFMGADTIVRFRPHFFPFTEPSFEVDMSKPGLKIRGKEWLEVAGCGMVDPNVLKGVGLDPERYNGFAFGMGVERMAMMIHNIPDLRYFNENDLRFLRQFATA